MTSKGWCAKRSTCRFGLLVVGFGHLKIHFNDGFEGFSLTPQAFREIAAAM